MNKEIPAGEQAGCKKEGQMDPYRQIFERDLLPKLIIDPASGAVINANHAALQFYGYTAEKIRRLKIWEINTMPEERVRQALMKAVEGNKIYKFKHRLADGGIRDVEVYTGPIRIDGAVLVYSTIYDITAHNIALCGFYEAESRYRSLFTNMEDGFAYCRMITDEKNIPVDYIFLEMNIAFEKIMRIKKEELINHRISELMADFDPAFNLFEFYGYVAASGDHYKTEKYSSRCDKWYEISVYSPDRGSFATIISDISGRKKIEEAINESNEFLKSVFSVLPANIAILNETGMVVYVNEAWRRSPAVNPFFGKNCGTGINYFEFLNFAAEEFKHISADITEAINGVMLRNLQNYSNEIFYEGRGIRAWYAVAVTHFEWPDSVRTVISFEDITERRDSEERIRKLSQAVESSPSVVIITDTEGNIEYVNPKFTELTLYKSDEVIGKNPRLLKSDDKKTSEYCELWECIKTGKEWRGEFHNRKKNGELYWEAASISSIKNRLGVITNFLAVKEDITERKRISEELLKAKEKADAANVLKSSFLANMSHEIRTPMNSVIGFADMLSKTKLNAEQQELVDLVKIGGQSLLFVINDILDFSKIEAGKIEIENYEFNIQTVIDDVAKITYDAALRKGLNILFSIDSRIFPDLIGDPGRLKQVLLNLVINAIKFTDKGKINIDAELECEMDGRSLIKFSVADEGIGISEKLQADIFDPFIQADNSVSRKHSGTGLGLTISNNLVKLMGSSGIDLESFPGKGSIFSFSIDFVHGSGVKKIIMDAESLNMGFRRDQKYSVLVVEDNASNVKLVERYLTGEGHRVCSAGNGREAVEMVLKNKFDIVLMDIQMPEMDGITAARVIRESGFNMPIIALTASAMKGDRDECIEAGMDDYISKPFSVENLLNAIHRTVHDKSKGKGAAKIFTAEEKQFEKKEVLSSGDIKILDVEKLKLNMSGITELMKDSAAMFVEYSTPYMAEILKAIDAGDPALISRAAHKLKGTALNACALSAAALLLKLEETGRSGVVSDARELYGLISIQLKLYKEEAEKAGLLN